MKQAAWLFVAGTAAMSLVAPGFVASAMAQSTGGATAGSATAGSSTGTPTGGRPAGSVIPSTPTTSSKGQSEVSRPIFVSGKVVTDDGSPVPSNVTIQRICSGSAHAVAYADAKGRFNFQWGQNSAMLADASEAGFGARNGPTSSGFGGAQSASGSGTGNDPFGNAMINCALRASIAGYRSELVNLFSHTSMDIPEIGNIVIHRLANVEGTSVSATSYLAPRDARKAYEHGLQSLLKNKNDDAAKDFEKAVASYPKYAEAWMNLGKVRLMQRSFEPARAALLKAVEADSKLVSPYVELGLLAGQEQKWEDSSHFLDQAVRLDPLDFPQAWYADAVANYNLKKYEVAEKSAREAVKLDPKHVNPRADYLLGLVLIERQDFAGAANELRTYIELSPSGSDIPSVRTQVSALEKALENK